MVNKTYRLSHPDAEKLLSYACRYRAIRTTIDETHGTLTVLTSFADSTEPNSVAERFSLEVVSESAPQMPPDEYRRRVEGKPF
jgi:hypothetical protein